MQNQTGQVPCNDGNDINVLKEEQGVVINDPQGNIGVQFDPNKRRFIAKIFATLSLQYILILFTSLMFIRNVSLEKFLMNNKNCVWLCFGTFCIIMIVVACFMGTVRNKSVIISFINIKINSKAFRKPIFVLNVPDWVCIQLWMCLFQLAIATNDSFIYNRKQYKPNVICTNNTEGSQSNTFSIIQRNQINPYCLIIYFIRRVQALHVEYHDIDIIYWTNPRFSWYHYALCDKGGKIYILVYIWKDILGRFVENEQLENSDFIYAALLVYVDIFSILGIVFQLIGECF